MQEHPYHCPWCQSWHTRGEGCQQSDAYEASGDDGQDDRGEGDA